MGSRSMRAVIPASFAIALFIIPSTSGAQAVVRGVLYDDATGVPLRGTVMLVDPQSDAAVVHEPTDSLGNFSLQTKHGTYRIVAIRPGYKSVTSAPVPLANGERLTIRVPIAEFTDPNHKIGVLERVRPNQESANEAGRPTMTSAVEMRKRLGTGLQYSRAQLDKSGLHSLGQFLQSVPGLRIGDPTSASTVQMSRNLGMSGVGYNSPAGACHVGWFLDGRRIDLPGRNDPMTDGLATLSLETIETVEVFRGISEMPVEFAAPDLRCGAVSIWSRR